MAQGECRPLLGAYETSWMNGWYLFILPIHDHKCRHFWSRCRWGLKAAWYVIWHLVYCMFVKWIKRNICYIILDIASAQQRALVHSAWHPSPSPQHVPTSTSCCQFAHTTSTTARLVESHVLFTKLLLSSGVTATAIIDLRMFYFLVSFLTYTNAPEQVHVHYVWHSTLQKIHGYGWDLRGYSYYGWKLSGAGLLYSVI